MKKVNRLIVILLAFSIMSCTDEMGEIQVEEETEELKAQSWLNQNVTTGWHSSRRLQWYMDGGWGKLNTNSGRDYTIEYKNNNDIVGGLGWQTGTTSRTIKYNIKKATGSYAFIGVYGWAKKGGNIIEYYINERKNGDGAGAINGTNLNKDFNTNGRNYRFKKESRYGPHAYGGGDTNFTQFISENKGNVGLNSTKTISMSRHFEQWGWDGGISGSWGSHLYQVVGPENFNGKWGQVRISIN